MILCNEQNRDNLKKYTLQLLKFVQIYTSITDAYVSDFFFLNHWEKLPTTWQDCLPYMTTEELSAFLDRTPMRTSHVLPLSLLSFNACTKKFSANRQCRKNIDNEFKVLFPRQRTQGNGQDLTKESAANLKLIPAADDEMLHSFFRKHVKPKKQHEIQSLGKVIKLLSDNIGCSNVIDVGAGLGHLTRFLSFGYGLSVTSVEAASTHAPKATKYDREVDREIRKKKMKMGEVATTPDDVLASMSHPCHVTSMIHSNMSSEHFLATIKSAQKIQGGDEEAYAIEDGNTAEGRNVYDNTAEGRNVYCNTAEGRNVYGNAAEGRKVYRNTAEGRNIYCDTVKQSKCHTVSSLNCCDSQVLNNLSEDAKQENLEHKKRDKTQIIGMEKGLDVMESACKPDVNVLEVKETYMEVASIEKHANEKETLSDKTNMDQKLMSCITPWPFILTGLHACGDLTPTFLRFFVNCSTAIGLASVGCCYMKISDESCDVDAIGYPMSQYTAGVSHHRLSYNARELACHFADRYSQRLKDCTVHLKIHSYRAALEWLANAVCTDFQRSSVQIPAKKTDQMDFQSYARLGLKKLNLSAELMTPNLLDTAQTMTDRWKDVVAFYTLRLALAPVVETLILIDRMLFLDEHGFSSALIPIFDPSISPRNFVLLSWKEGNFKSNENNPT